MHRRRNSRCDQERGGEGVAISTTVDCRKKCGVIDQINIDDAVLSDTVVSTGVIIKNYKIDLDLTNCVAAALFASAPMPSTLNLPGSPTPPNLEQSSLTSKK